MTHHELIRFLVRLNSGLEPIQDASYVEYTTTYIMAPHAVNHLRDTLETLKGKQAMIDKDYEDEQDQAVNKLFVAQLHNFSIVLRWNWFHL